jgi:hypothetical protein
METNEVLRSRKYNQLISVSNPELVYNNLQKYLRNATDLYISNRKNKKYMILNPYTNKMVHFGDIRYEDLTRHFDPIRRNSYLRRATNIRGTTWKDDPYSSNNLAIWTLWNIL